MPEEERIRLENDRVDKDFEEAQKSIRAFENEGKANIIKHFDRLHDKLFDLNNILIAAFLAFTQLGGKVPVRAILFPIVNLVILIWVEYSMMEKSRFESNIGSVEMGRALKKHKAMINRTNRFSLLTIISTGVVLFALLYFLLR